MSTPPLQGIRVLDLSRLLPGPLCSLFLTDLGAEVIKIEEPGLGDYVRHSPPFLKDGSGVLFAALNRGKKSVALDLKTDGGREALLKLLPTADILIESFRPGVLARLGLDNDVLKAARPDLIMVSLTGYGQTGPLKDKAGHDVGYMALSGGLSMVPVLHGVQVADVGGALSGAMGAVAALLGRLRHNTGFQHIDVSLCESVIPFNLLPLAQYLAEQKPIPPAGTVLTGALACYGTYTTKDGHTAAFGALEPKFFKRFLTAAGLPANLIGMQFSDKKQDELRATLQDWWSNHTLAEAMALLQDADACIEPVLSTDEVIAHPMHQQRGVFPPPTGAVPIAIRITPPGLPTAPMSAAPALGAHNADLLTPLGYSPDDAAALVTQGGKAAKRMI